MDLRQIATPSDEPVTLAEAKLHLRLDSGTEDALVTAWMQAARQMVEAQTGRALLPQDWEMRLPCFPCGAIELPHAPLQGVLSIKTYDAAEAATTIAASAYQVEAPSGERAQRGCIYPAANSSWPSTVSGVRGAVRIQYRAGYASAPQVPQPLRAAMLLALGDLYANREQAGVSNVTENPAFARLLAPYRLFW